MVADLPINLVVLIIGTIDRLEGDSQCARFRRMHVEFGGDEPWTCEGIDEFICPRPASDLVARRAKTVSPTEQSLGSGRRALMNSG